MKTPFTPRSGHCFCWLLFLLMVSELPPGWAQNSPIPAGRVTNIRLSAVNQTSLEILYDLAVSEPGDSVYFEVTGRKSGLLRFSPGFVEGDFGRHVRAGLNRRIVWNVLANGYELNEDIRVRVLLKSGRPASITADSTTHRPPATELATTGTAATRPQPRPYRPGGPLTALLSVVVPGLGSVFVQNPRPKVGLRPVVTAGVIGAMAYGFHQRNLSNAQYDLYEQQKNPAAGESYFRQANQQYHRYYLATRAAAAVWLADITATLIRGLHNRSVRHGPGNVRLRPDYQANTPVAALSIRF